MRVVINLQTAVGERVVGIFLILWEIVFRLRIFTASAGTAVLDAVGEQESF